MSVELGSRVEVSKSSQQQYVLLGGELRRFAELKELNGRVTPDYVRANTRFSVVTDDLLDQSKRVVAQTYWETLEPSCSVEDVYRQLLDDGNTDNSFTVSAMLNIPDPTEPSTLVASGNELVICSMRFVRGKDNSQNELFPIKEMYEVVAPWSTILQGEDPKNVTTVGRYAVISPIAKHEQLSKANISGWLTGELLRLGRDHTVQMIPENEHFYAVMSPIVVRHVKRGNVEATELPSQLWRESQNYYHPVISQIAKDANRMYDTFPKYWRRSRPALYRFGFNNLSEDSTNK